MPIPLQNNPLLLMNLKRAEDLGNPFALHLEHSTTDSRLSFVYSLIQRFEVKNSILSPLVFTSIIPDECIIKIPETFTEDTDTTYTGYIKIPSEDGTLTPHSISGLEVLLTATDIFPHLSDGDLISHIDQGCAEETICDACIYRLDSQEILRDYFKERDPDNARFNEIADTINHCIRARINKWSQSRPPINLCLIITRKSP